MAPLYTHTFKFKVEGQDFSGEIEFNVDGEMGYKTDKLVEWKSLAQVNRFHALLKEFKNVFDCFGEIEKISIVKK